MSDEIDVLETKVVLDASEALKALNDLLKSTAEYQDKVNSVAILIQTLSAVTGKTFQDIAKFLNSSSAVIGMSTKVISDGLKLATKDAQISDAVFSDLQESIKKADSEFNSLSNSMNVVRENTSKTTEEIQVMLEALKQVQDQESALKDKLASFGSVSTGAGSLKGIDLTSIKEAVASMDTFEGKVSAIKAAIIGLAQTFGVSFEQAASALKSADVAAGTTDRIVSTALKDIQQESTNSAKSVSSFAESFKASMSEIGSAIQTALGLGIYQIVNNLINGFQQLISTGIEYEKVLFRVQAANDLILSKGSPFNQGPDVQAQASAIQQDFPNVSKMDALKGAADLAILTRELGVTQEQTLKFNQAISATSILLGTDLSDAARSAGAAIESGRVQGLKKMGFDIDDLTVKQRALAMGAVEVNGAIDAQAKRLAIISLIVEQSNTVYAEALKYQDTTPGKIDKATASWNNLVVTIGTKLAPALNTAADGFDKAFVAVDHMLQALKPIDGVEFPQFIKDFFNLNAVVTTVIQTFIVFGSLIDAVVVTAIETAQGKIHSLSDALDHFSDAWKSIAKSMTTELLPAKPKAPALDTSSENYPTSTSTPAVDDKKLQSLQDTLLKELQSYGDQADKISRDFYEKEEKLLEDYTQKVQREDEDYQNSRQDVIDSTNTKIEDAQRRYHEQEKNDEAKFQLAMKELREKFLFDLEGALRNRDAGQVLRLLEQYKLNKQNLVDQHNLEKKQREEDFRDEMEQIKREEAQRLAQLDREHALKLQRMKEDYDHQKAQDAQNNKDQMDDLKLQAQRRLEEYSRDLAKELGLREGAAGAIYDVLAKFYGPNGLFDGLYDYSYQSLVAKTAAMLSQLTQIYSQYQPTDKGGTTPPPTDVTPPPNSKSGPIDHPFADGGIAVANKPTRVLFGEKNPELAAFIPLNKIASLFGSGGNGGGGNSGNTSGKMKIEVELSPGLEAKIVNQSLDSFADVIATVRRNRN